MDSSSKSLKKQKDIVKGGLPDQRDTYESPALSVSKLSHVVCGSFGGTVDSGNQAPEPG